MRKIIIPLALFTTISCNTTQELYRPYKLKKISEDLSEIQHFIEQDWKDDKIEEGTARNYFLLIKSLSYQLEQEYTKANKIYKLNTNTKR